LDHCVEVSINKQIILNDKGNETFFYLLSDLDKSHRQPAACVD